MAQTFLVKLDDDERHYIESPTLALITRVIHIHGMRLHPSRHNEDRRPATPVITSIIEQVSTMHL